MLDAYWFQEEAINSIFEYFSVKNGNPIIAMPTGTGKALVIAKFIHRVLKAWPDQRILMLTDSGELVKQNTLEMWGEWPGVPLGINSDKLDRRDTQHSVIFGTIQSVYKCAQLLGFRHLLIIDEAHMLSPSETSMYQTLIVELKKINPFLKVIGFTATPYRMKQGFIVEPGSIFTDICYDITGFEQFNRLIFEGYLCPLVGPDTKTKVDLRGVNLNVEKQIDKAVDKAEIIESACRELISYSHGRISWMGFASSISNAEHIAECLQSLGINAACVHSKLPDAVNDERIRAFKNLSLQCLVGKDKLVKGFNHRPTDLIFDLQPTNSPGKHVQKGGRGTRISPETGKINCLYLDFSGNVARCGPINDPRIPNKPGKGGGAAPVKECPNKQCRFTNHASARFCLVCNTEFLFKINYSDSVSNDSPMRVEHVEIKTFSITKVIYNRHQKVGSKPCIKVSYFCGSKQFNEFVCFEHIGMAAKNAKNWWMQRHQSLPPAQTDDALKFIAELRTPKKIAVKLSKPYPEIINHEF